MDCSIAKIGPVGGNVGGTWDDIGHTEVAQIFISYNRWRITQIQFEYVDKNGSLVLSDEHGEKGIDDIVAVVKFSQKPKEFIKEIRGHQDCGITRLEFTTNIGTYGPFGISLSNMTHYQEKFSIEIGEGCLAGFHGTAAEVSGGLSLGVHLKPRKYI